MEQTERDVNSLRALDIYIDIKERELAEALARRQELVGRIVAPHMAEQIMVSFESEG